jgi:hypothetical protein
MACVLNVGYHYFFFESAATAAKVADALNKAIRVEYEYKAGAGKEYRHLRADDRQIDIEIKMTAQSKPASALKALPEHAQPNNEFFQIKKGR